MFGGRHASGMSAYRRMKSGTLPPVREVTTAEFVAAAVAAGMSEKDATLHAKLSATMGASTMVGDAMLRVVDVVPPPAGE